MLLQLMADTNYIKNAHFPKKEAMIQKHLVHLLLVTCQCTYCTQCAYRGTDTAINEYSYLLKTVHIEHNKFTQIKVFLVSSMLVSGDCDE